MEDMLVVDSDVVARALTLGGVVAYLRPFVWQDATVAGAAAELDEPIQRVHYRVQRLVHLGLLVVTAIEARAGRPVKHYRATAYAYHIPARILPEQLFPLTQAQHAADLQRAIEAARPELVHDGDVRVSFPAQGAPNIDRIVGESMEWLLGEAAPAVLSTWMNLQLTAPEAKRLQHDLWNVLLRYAAIEAAANGETRGRDRHVVHLAMAPAPRS